MLFYLGKSFISLLFLLLSNLLKVSFRFKKTPKPVGIPVESIMILYQFDLLIYIL